MGPHIDAADNKYQYKRGYKYKQIYIYIHIHTNVHSIYIDTYVFICLLICFT